MDAALVQPTWTRGFLATNRYVLCASHWTEAMYSGASFITVVPRLRATENAAVLTAVRYVVQRLGVAAELARN